MAHRYKVEALVLSRKNIGEADRLVTFFTEEHGLLKVVAKGVRKMPSARGGHLEPFTRVLALLSESRAGIYVGGVETLEYFHPLHQQQHSALVHARNVAFIITRLFDEQDAQEVLFKTFGQALKVLPAASREKQRMIEGGLLLLAVKMAGLLPDLDVCQRCHVEKVTEAVVFDAREGGWHCVTCHNGLRGTKHSLAARLLPAVRLMANQPNVSARIKVSEEESKQILMAIRRFTINLVDQPVQGERRQALAHG